MLQNFTKLLSDQKSINVWLKTSIKNIRYQQDYSSREFKLVGQSKKQHKKKKKKSFQACFLKSQYDNVQLYSTGSLHVQVSVLCFACLLTIIVFPVLAASSTAWGKASSPHSTSVIQHIFTSVFLTLNTFKYFKQSEKASCDCWCNARFVFQVRLIVAQSNNCPNASTLPHFQISDSFCLI